MRKMPTTKQIDELQKLIDTGTVPGINVEWEDVKDKPSFAEVATTGDYEDLSNKPSIPTKTSNLINDSGFITNQDIPKNGVFIAIQGTTTYSELRAAYNSGNYGWFIAIWHQENEPTVPQYAVLASATSTKFTFRQTFGLVQRTNQYNTLQQIGTNQWVPFMYTGQIEWSSTNPTGLQSSILLPSPANIVIYLEADSTTLQSGDYLEQQTDTKYKLTYSDLAYHSTHIVRLYLRDSGTIVIFQPTLIKTGINGTNCVLNYKTSAAGYTTWKLTAEPVAQATSPEYANRNNQIAKFKITK